jgi:hypothetical protein
MRTVSFTGNSQYSRVQGIGHGDGSPHTPARRLAATVALSGLALAGVCALLLPKAFDEWRLPVIAMLATGSCVTYWLVLAHVRKERARLRILQESARAEAATLTSRTVRHHLANELAVTLGYSEMLAEDPRLPQELEEQAEHIRASAMAAVNTVDQLRKDIRGIELDQRVAGPPLLDIEGSTADHDAPASP